MRPLILSAAIVTAILLVSMPESPWEFDELLFMHALQRYDPIAHHPPPPGYPVFILVGQAVRPFSASDFGALRAISVAGSAIGFVLLALAFGKIAEDGTTGITAALLFYLSPAMLVHATLALSEPGALALLAAALFFAPRSPGWFAVFAALTVGWRPQFCFFVVPLLLASLFLMKSWRARVIVLVLFTLVCLAWLLPLTVAVGGIEQLVRFETLQAKYVAAHDASLSRSAWTPGAMIVHFVSHPWGTRLMALPVLCAAAAGVWRLRRSSAALVLGVAGLVYIVVALMIMDPADGVRYSIPFVLVVSLLAAAGVTSIAWRPYWLVSIFAAGSIVYVSSFVVQRSSTASPPVQAAAFASRTIAPNAAIGYDSSLWPHATYLLRDHPLFRIDARLQQLFGRPDLPLYGYVDGISEVSGARLFGWENSDAYWNLTRNHYRVVSLTPLGPDFRAIRGVYVLECVRATDCWRWLDAYAVIETPRATGVELHLALPAIYPFPDNIVTVIADEKPVGEVRLRPGEVVPFAADFPAPSRVLRLRSVRSFNTPSDPRHLAVKLYDLTFRLRR